MYAKTSLYSSTEITQNGLGILNYRYLFYLGID